MATTPPPTIAGPDRHALDLDVHLHVPLDLLQRHQVTEAGTLMAQVARRTTGDDLGRVRSALLRSALSSIIDGDHVRAAAMLDALALVLFEDAATALRKVTP
jgi:hypothetical protein